MEENTLQKVCNFLGRIKNNIKLAAIRSWTQISDKNKRNSYVLGIFPELKRNNSSMDSGKIPHLL